MGKAKSRWIIGLGVIGICLLGLSFLSLQRYSVYFFTPQEARAKSIELASKSIRVGGMVKAGSVDWQPVALTLRFIMTDFQGNDIRVYHHGPPPDMFKENSGVVVEGRISANGETFEAERLFVKHSEEYKVPDKDHAVDPELLRRSMFQQ